MSSKVASRSITRVYSKNLRTEETPDLVVVEEPLQISLEWGEENNRQQRIFLTTMRTPGNDFELAIGLLLAEWVIHSKEDILKIENTCIDKEEKDQNGLLVHLRPSSHVPFRGERNTVMNASCGICSKDQIEELAEHIQSRIPETFTLKSEDIFKLNHGLDDQQLVFKTTGGLHAAALFASDGNLLMVREDIGRHNALDKLIGAFTWQETSLNGKTLLLSGRIGYELIQKAVVGGIELIVAFGAPSSLAVEMADYFGITLVGFLSNTKFNIYTHPQRIQQ